MLYKGLMVTMLSGSLDGLVASHNRGGPYFRNRTIPTDPNSEQQQFMRAAMSDVANGWNAMTASERAAWENYAASVTTTNRIGDKHSMTGREAWSQFALPQYQQVEALDIGRIVRKTPPLYPIADFHQTPHVNSLTTSELVIAWEDDGLWEGSPNADNGFIVHLGRPHSALINWYNGPFKPFAWLEGDEDDPVTSPHTFTLPEPWQPGVGQALDIRIRLFREDRPNGRVWQIRAICTA